MKKMKARWEAFLIRVAKYILHDRNVTRSPVVSRPVLRAIGRAVRAQFDATETDMLRLELDNGGAVVVFSPEVRDTVTEAEGVSLLSE